MGLLSGAGAAFITGALDRRREIVDARDAKAAKLEELDYTFDKQQEAADAQAGRRETAAINKEDRDRTEKERLAKVKGDANFNYAMTFPGVTEEIAEGYRSGDIDSRAIAASVEVRTKRQKIEKAKESAKTWLDTSGIKKDGVLYGLVLQEIDAGGTGLDVFDKLQENADGSVSPKSTKNPVWIKPGEMQLMHTAIAQQANIMTMKSMNFNIIRNDSIPDGNGGFYTGLVTADGKGGGSAAFLAEYTERTKQIIGASRAKGHDISFPQAANIAFGEIVAERTGKPVQQTAAQGGGRRLNDVVVSSALSDISKMPTGQISPKEVNTLRAIVANSNNDEHKKAALQELQRHGQVN